MAAFRHPIPEEARRRPEPVLAPPVKPPVPGWREVENERREGLTPEQAREVLDPLGARLAERPGRRLRLSWVIEEPADRR